MPDIGHRLTRKLKALIGGGPPKLTLEELSRALTTGHKGAKEAALQVLLDGPAVPADGEPDPRFAAVLAALVTEDDPAVLTMMAKVAERCGGASAAEAHDALLAHPDPRVVSATLESVGRGRDPRLFPRLLPLLHSAEPRVKATALAVIRKLDLERGGDALVALMEAPGKAAEKRAAVLALPLVPEVPLELVRRLKALAPDEEQRGALAGLLAARAPGAAERLSANVEKIASAVSGSFSLKEFAPEVSKSGQIKVNKVSGRITRPSGAVAAPPPPARGRAWIAVSALAVVGLAIGGYALMSEAPSLAEPVKVKGPLDGRTAARAPATEVTGKSVTWSGKVLRVKGARVVLAVPGGTADVVLPEGQARPQAGDVIEVTGRVAGKSATGLVYVDASQTIVTQPRAPRPVDEKPATPRARVRARVLEAQERRHKPGPLASAGGKR